MNCIYYLVNHHILVLCSNRDVTISDEWTRPVKHVTMYWCRWTKQCFGLKYYEKNIDWLMFKYFCCLLRLNPVICWNKSTKNKTVHVVQRLNNAYKHDFEFARVHRTMGISTSSKTVYICWCNVNYRPSLQLSTRTNIDFLRNALYLIA